jgi:hypothetical protein
VRQRIVKGVLALKPAQFVHRGVLDRRGPAFGIHNKILRAADALHMMPRSVARDVERRK